MWKHNWEANLSRVNVSYAAVVDGMMLAWPFCGPAPWDVSVCCDCSSAEQSLAEAGSQHQPCLLNLVTPYSLCWCRVLGQQDAVKWKQRQTSCSGSGKRRWRVRWFCQRKSGMLPRLGAPTEPGSAVCTLLEWCWFTPDADVVQIVLQSSWDVDQTRYAFGKPTGHVSYLSQVACPSVGSGWGEMPVGKQLADMSQGFISRVQPSGFEGVLFKGEAEIVPFTSQVFGCSCICVLPCIKATG